MDNFFPTRLEKYTFLDKVKKSIFEKNGDSQFVLKNLWNSINWTLLEIMRVQKNPYNDHNIFVRRDFTWKILKFGDFSVPNRRWPTGFLWDGAFWNSFRLWIGTFINTVVKFQYINRIFHRGDSLFTDITSQNRGKTHIVVILSKKV